MPNNYGHRRGVKPCFLKLILFYIVVSRLQDAFYHLKNLNYFLRCDQSKSGLKIGSLWEGKTKTVKKDYLFYPFMALTKTNYIMNSLTNIVTFSDKGDN